MDESMQFIDLHTHSQASDGTDSPGQLVRNAQIQGLAAVAVTDHDTVSGLGEAEAAARDLGLEFVRGCELSTSTELGEMHVLGLWLPRDLAPLQDRLQYLRRKRSERNVRIVEKLQGPYDNVVGLPLDLVRQMLAEWEEEDQ